METILDTRVVLKDLMQALHQDFDQREAFQQKAERRLKIWLAMVAIGILVVGVYLFWLMNTMNANMASMTKSMTRMTGDIAIMRQEFQSVSSAMDTMKQDMGSVATSVSVVPDIAQTVKKMAWDMKQINMAVHGMNAGMGHMTRDVNKMTHPGQMMRSFFPF